MKLLLDTHLLLWVAEGSARLSRGAIALIEDAAAVPMFSPISLLEVAIKNGLGRADFQVDPRVLRRGLTDNGYTELPVTGEHAVAVDGLPAIHKDPFDRVLIAQATVEGALLLTADAMVGRYGGVVRLV